MSDKCKDHLVTVRAKAVELGAEAELDWVLNYVREYSGGPEEEWKTTIAIDVPFNEDEMNFIATVHRRIPREDAGYSDEQSGLRHFMTMGMIYDKKDKRWYTHS